MVNMNEEKITTDDLLLLIGEREVKLYQARQEKAQLIERAQSAVAEAGKVAAIEQLLATSKADQQNISDNCARLQARNAGLSQRLDTMRQELDAAMAELARRDELAARFKGKKK
jgi:hypothetical protein